MGKLIGVRAAFKQGRKQGQEGRKALKDPAVREWARSQGYGPKETMAAYVGQNLPLVGASAGAGAAVAGGTTAALMANRNKRRPQNFEKAFASRDQNSSIGTSTSTVSPASRNKATTTNAHTTRSGVFAGKQRGVGRNLSRDQNSTPGSAVIRTPTLRQINGKFAGQGQGVKVFHPSRYGSSHRQPRDNRVQIWRKNGDDVARTFSGKQKESVGKGMLGPVDLASMAPHTGARVGRRLPS